MDPATNQEQRDHDLAMSVFAVSAGMVGVCLTGIGLLRVVVAQTDVQTLGDDLLAADALLFVLSASLAFWSFKTKSASRRKRLRVVVDVLFLLGLAAMGAICAVIAYAIV